MASCPQCGRQVPADRKFCRHCGWRLAEDESPAVVGDFVSPQFLARMVRPNEMPVLLSKPLEIREGESVLLFSRGKHLTTLTSGRHSMGGILGSGDRDASVVLFQTSDVLIPLSMGRLFTSDPLPVTVQGQMVLKVEQPLLLWTNLAAEPDSYTWKHLAGALYPSVEEGCEIFFKSRSIKELAAHADLSRDLEQALASHMEQVLARSGIRLVSLQGMNLSCEAWDEVTQSRTEYFITASMEATEREGRKGLFDVYQDSQLQTMAQETAQVASIEKRISLWARLRQAILSNARNELRSKAELEDLVCNADKDRLLRDSEREELARSVGEANEDPQKARKFALRRVKFEGEHELRKLELWHRYGLEPERLTMETTAAREEMEGRWGIELRRLGLEIDGQRWREQFQREQEATEQESPGRTRLGQARATTIEEMEREQDRADIDMGLDAIDRYKRDQISREWKRRLHALEETERQLEMRLKKAKVEHDYEISRIQTLSTAGIETLIAVSGPEQSQLLAQLARTRALAGCSSQQILAMQAADSPQIAGALKEILTATAATDQLDQYVRLVAELKESAQASREDYQQNLTVLHQMFDKALDSVKETAVAFSYFPTAVAAPQPDLRSHASPEGIVTVFYSDIEGSTAITDRLGDHRAQEVFREHNAIIRRHLERRDGFEVKSMGDGFMLAFASAYNGIQCAIDIQRTMAIYSRQHPDEPVRVRIGIHTGETIKESEDFFGRIIIIAARISSKAQGGQILVSSLVKELTERSGDIRFSAGHEVELKGLAGQTRIHQVEWE